MVGSNGAVKMKANSEAGTANKVRGYYLVGLHRKTHYAHRIIAILHDIDIDGKVIDHVDRNKANNRIDNLRAVSQKENLQNKRQQSLGMNNTSGILGVNYDKHSDRWLATWRQEGKEKRKYFPIKNFQSSEEAFNAAYACRQQMVELYYTKE